MPKAQVASRPWTREEDRVVDRFARAIVQGTYRNVKEALPECQRELRRAAPAIRRTDVAVAWAVLCRAYDFGLPRRKHLWTDEELRLLERHASALARGKYPDIVTAARCYKTACGRAGLAARHPDNTISTSISVRAHALGYDSSRANPPLGPEELRIITGFSRALARGRYSCGRAAVPDCLRALSRAGLEWQRPEHRLVDFIKAGARRLGWQAYERWSERDIETVRQFAMALAAGRYRTVKAALRACLKSLRSTGRHKSLAEGNLRWRFSRCFVDMYGRLWRPAWSPEELRILDRFARACIRGRYPSVAAAARACGVALERAGLTEHLGGRGLRSKLLQRVHGIRATA
ncbi:MAG: hypothetical protein NTX53_13040 [candidate division WOR-3 bacterium]|nr:hypothetical protein [candidate division WOR-3 bacterium]